MKKTLALLPNNLGDVIMTLPVLEALKKKYPEQKLSFFVEEGYEGGLINFKYCDNIIPFKRKAIRDLMKSDAWESGVEALKLFVEKLKVEEFDLIINLSQIGYISCFVSLLKSNNIIGQKFLVQGNHCIEDNWSTYLYAIPFGRHFNSLHVTDIYKRIAGVSDTPSNAGIFIKDDEKRKIEEYITSRRKNSDSPIIVFQPGAAYDSKRWPVENFILLGKKLIDDGFTIFITGDSAERNLAERLQYELGENCIATSGELSFRESIVLLSFSEFCVTSDTAIMHVAASLSKKVFALFGPTNPVETGPYSAGNIIFAGRCNNRPCFCIECKTKLCMRTISPLTVYSYIINKPDSNPSCDIYRTSFEGGLYCLLTVVEHGSSYYSKTGSMITRRSLGEDVSININSAEYEEICEKSKDFIKSVLKMKDYLYSYITSNSREYIQLFESAKMNLNVAGGINEFWTAMLNIRLNSVPVLNPLSAVRESINICENITSQIETALSR